MKKLFAMTFALLVAGMTWAQSPKAMVLTVERTLPVSVITQKELAE